MSTTYGEGEKIYVSNFTSAVLRAAHLSSASFDNFSMDDADRKTPVALRRQILQPTSLRLADT